MMLTKEQYKNRFKSNVVIKATKRNEGIIAYLDKLANVETIYLEKKSVGLRIDIHMWIETGECEISLIDGNGRTFNFKRHEQVILSNPTEEEIQVVVTDFKSYAIDLLPKTFSKRGINCEL